MAGITEAAILVGVAIRLEVEDTISVRALAGVVAGETGLLDHTVEVFADVNRFRKPF